MATDIYGEVSNLQDIRDINREICQEMNGVRGSDQRTELKKRSDYLCTLTLAPSWQQRFGKKSDRYLEVARTEDLTTTSRANSIAKRKGFELQYHPWEVVDHGQQSF
jgi:hypothetical protein